MSLIEFGFLASFLFALLFAMWFGREFFTLAFAFAFVISMVCVLVFAALVSCLEMYFGEYLSVCIAATIFESLLLVIAFKLEDKKKPGERR